MKKELEKKRFNNSVVIAASIIIIIALILVIGKNYITGNITGNMVQDTCKDPYILVGGNCCLDKDSNQICDKDETSPINIMPTIAAEECFIQDRLTCAGKKMASNSIILKLRNDKAGIFSPTSIEIANVGKEGCKGVYSGAVEDGFDYEKIKEFNINCNINKQYVDSLVIIKGIVYERSHVRGPALMPYNILEFSTDGYIKGAVE